MKNYEKYADEIRGYNGYNICTDFIEPYILKVEDCDHIGCSRCNMLQMLWLLEDYEETETDWSKVEVDTPILVRYSEDGEWLRRHFAKYQDGIVYAWTDAYTSWTGDFVTPWELAKLAESEVE